MEKVGNRNTFVLFRLPIAISAGAHTRFFGQRPILLSLKDIYEQKSLNNYKPVSYRPVRLFD